jgi:hypothetical protein
MFAQQLAEVSGKTSVVSDVGEFSDSEMKSSLLEMLP